MHFRVHFVLKDIQIVCGRNSNDVFRGVPGGVQNFLGEVQAVGADIVFPPLAPGAHTARLQDRPRLAVLAGGLQSHVALRVSVEHSEKVVVGPGHDDAAVEEEQGD